MPAKKRLIFVDDEQNILDGLRRMLRSMRSQWEMVFALGGHEALSQMQQQPFDIIISDMRMPGMSGLELLTEVRRRYPSTVRMVLSGQADREDILNSIGPIHQFLQKPCSEEVLKDTLTRTLQIVDMLADEKLKGIVAGLESLPSPLTHQQELMERFSSPDVSIKQVGESIGKDLAMSAKVLQLVNSAFFGLRRHISNPMDAVTLLGLDTVRSLVVAMHVFSQVSPNHVEGFSQESLFTHSVAVAGIAKRVSLDEGMSEVDAEDAYLAGLLHDVGKLVLASTCPEGYSTAMQTAHTNRTPEHEAESRVIGASHGEVGAYLLGLWAFNMSVIEAALYHHDPCQHSCQTFSIATAVHVANAIVHRDHDAGATELAVDTEYLESIGVLQRLGGWSRMSSRVA